ncbi:MAG: hypothetical protein H7318_06140 [Oligoflexus sp.]|nr:hypothetical protein [Oligoflexus sp.]
MKHIAIRLLTLSCLASPTLAAAKGKASGSVYQAVIHAELQAKNSTTYTGGTLDLDGRVGQVELTLQPKMPACAEGMMCAQLMPEPISYVLEGATTEVDHCGIIRTRVQKDDRPVDGMFLSIIINNNRGNSCPTFAALPALDVIVEKKYYNRIQGGEVQQLDTFEAADFAMINPGTKDVAFTGKVLGARYKNKKLDLKLQYSGGCQDHAFDLKWGECKDVKILNSIISECAVTILHTQGADDTCEALVTKTQTIDLSGIAQAYIINLNGTRVLIH